MTLTVAVAGASGYAGGELLRVLAEHDELQVRTVTGHSSVGQKLIDVQPHLRSYGDLELKETSVETLQGHDVVCFALPHGASGELSDSLGNDSVLVDCGADHRLEQAADWQAYYGGEMFETWSYGVPELLRVGSDNRALQKQRDRLRGVRKIAAPGCNASTVALSLAPGIAAGVIAPEDLVTVLAVGPSGAGRALKPHLLGAELMGTANPYAVGGSHRHIPEILQSLRPLVPHGAHEPTLSFTPVLVPMSRGILATSTARLVPGTTAAAVREAWESAYAKEPFVRVLPEGHHPRTADVLGANMCLMSVDIDERAGRVVVVAAVDNLVKGTAGAAVQSLNIACGFAETTGLSVNGVAP